MGRGGGCDVLPLGEPGRGLTACGVYDSNDDTAAGELAGLMQGLVETG
jgi:hypothetical protein